MPELTITNEAWRLKRVFCASPICLLMALIMAYGCSNDISQQATGNGASSPDAVGFQLHTSLKEGDFSSLAYYTPDSQVIKKYYELTTNSKDADTRRNIWHYAQHITEKLEKEFREARQEATSRGIEWNRAKLDSVDIRQSPNNPRFADVSVHLAEDNQIYHFVAKCVRIENMWYISENIQLMSKE